VALKVEEKVPHHILIVEDDPNTADMLIAYFSSLGYEVSHAAWGEDALDTATKDPPDLVVLDIHLPDIDGYEVCMQLRSHRRTEHIPVIFLTERRDRMDRLTGLSLGAIDYITKPFDVQEMRYRVRNILRRSTSEVLLHPITGLPTARVLEDQIESIRQEPTLSLVGLRLDSMESFSDAYGFVTHDDVLRAVVLILRNTVREVMTEDPFVGQLSAYEFAIIIPEEQRYLVMGRLHQRLSEAISFFYPHQDWESGFLADGTPVPRITFEMGHLTSSEIPNDAKLSQIREALFDYQPEV
jgi:DNA-binding response OmpR family regulator